MGKSGRVGFHPETGAGGDNRLAMGLGITLVGLLCTALARRRPSPIALDRRKPRVPRDQNGSPLRPLIALFVPGANRGCGTLG